MTQPATYQNVKITNRLLADKRLFFGGNLQMATHLTRCGWVGESNIYIHYHDEEWGKPEFDSLKLFEKICLEGQ